MQKLVLLLILFLNGDEASLLDPRENTTKIYDVLVKDAVQFNGVIGNVGDILIKNKLINSTALVFKYKLIYYSPSILPSIISSSLPNQTGNSSSSSSNKESVFSIDSSDGAIRLRVPANYSTLEYLCKIKHACNCDSCIFNLNIIYSTRNKLNTNVVRVFIDDTNRYAPEFWAATSVVYVNASEASEIGDRIKILNAAAFDRDAYFNKITYKLSYTNNDDETTTVQEFKIESVDVESKNLNLIVNSKLDYEKQTKYEFFLFAQDNGLLKASLSLIVNIVDENDNSPICDKSLFEVSLRENKKSENLIKISAQDADSGLNGKVEYYLRNNNYLSDRRSLTNDEFEIDKETGWLSVIKPLNYKLRQNYLLTVKAKDVGSKNSYTTYCKVKINVLDDNDCQARFSIYKYLNETIEQGYYESSSDGIVNVQIYENNHANNLVLASIHLYDNDTVGNYKFTIGNEEDDSQFKITKISDNEYALVVLVPLDHEKQSLYLLNLTLYDLPIDAISSVDPSYNIFTWSQLLRVNVLDLNDNKPKFMQNYYEYTMNENSAVNLAINQTLKCMIRIA